MLKKLLNHQYNINFLQYHKIAIILSIILILSSLTILTVKGLNKGIDFAGGILLEARFDKAPSLKDLRYNLSQLNLGDVSLQNMGNPNDIMLRIGLDDAAESLQLKKITIIKNHLDQLYGDNIEYRRTDFVGPTIGKELVRSGVIALFYAIIIILIYIWVRFNYHFGVGALLALIHDVILLFGFFAILSLEFNLTAIAAILTIIGYSINDTVVIYDRIRENMRKYRSKTIKIIINKSLNECFNRTILTSLTTLIALLCLAIFGGAVLKTFSLGVLFGVIIGTYSSIYIAPILLNNNHIKKSK